MEALAINIATSLDPSDKLPRGQVLPESEEPRFGEYQPVETVFFAALAKVDPAERTDVQRRPDGSGLRGWMYTMLRNQAHHQFRRKLRNRIQQADDMEWPS